MREKEYLLKEIRRMKVGEHLVLGRKQMNLFSYGWPTIYDTPVQALLSSLPGSGCGAFRARVIPNNGDVVVSRHEESDKRYYTDPDRAHLYNRLPDGTLEFKEQQK